MLFEIYRKANSGGTKDIEKAKRDKNVKDQANKYVMNSIPINVNVATLQLQHKLDPTEA
jgi:hypothetical protein